MTIHLPPNLETPILAAVQSGRYASLDDAMAEAASLLLERLKQDQPTTPAASEANAVPTHKPIWERILERSQPFPMRNGTNCPRTLPSSMTIIFTARRSGHRHEANVRRYALLDRYHPPQRPMAPSRRNRQPRPCRMPPGHNRRSLDRGLERFFRGRSHAPAGSG